MFSFWVLKRVLTAEFAVVFCEESFDYSHVLVIGGEEGVEPLEFVHAESDDVAEDEVKL